MKILADENMPYVEHLFADMGEVALVNGRTLSAAQLKDVDVLLVRSVTQVNQKLLQVADNLKFVGSATIGVDHLDLDALLKQNITFANAPGCNAAAVGEYAFIAMLELAQRTGEPLGSKKVGILGAGNTGTALASRLQVCGIEVMLCDPFLQQAGDPRPFFSFPRLLAEADVISLHVPLTHDGPFPTWYLFDEDKLAALKKGTWLLNCCRGRVVDNKALFRVKSKRPDLRLVLDVWEGEPNPLVDLVPLVDIATPHIAGYSLEGKARGTLMLYQALKKFLGEKPDKKLVQLLPDFIYSHVRICAVPDEPALLRLCRLVYDLRDDDTLFRRQFMLSDGFDAMRRNHRHRREFSVVKLVKHGTIKVDWLTKLGFSGVNL